MVCVNALKKRCERYCSIELICWTKFWLLRKFCWYFQLTICNRIWYENEVVITTRTEMISTHYTSKIESNKMNAEIDRKY